MTTIVSQTASASNTKNTKENRKVVVAVFEVDDKTTDDISFVFKLPDNLDLEDETIVAGANWGVKRGVLNIPYTNRENYIKYTGETPIAENCTQTIQAIWLLDNCPFATTSDQMPDINWYENEREEKPDVKDDRVSLCEYPDNQYIEDNFYLNRNIYSRKNTKNTNMRKDEVVEKKVEKKETFYVMVEKCMKDGLLRERFETFQTTEEARTHYETECACRGVAVGERYRVEFGTCNEDGQPDDTIEFFENYETIEDTDEEEEEDEEDEADVVEKKVEEKVANTQNTKENRKVLAARYSDESIYKLPNNLDLEDKSVVKEYWVKWGELFISYTSLENWEKYTTQAEDENEFTQEVSTRNLPSPQWIQAIQSHYDCDDVHKVEIDDAEEYCVEYAQDEEDDN
jgi:hypothetical protein